MSKLPLVHLAEKYSTQIKAPNSNGLSLAANAFGPLVITALTNQPLLGSGTVAMTFFTTG